MCEARSRQFGVWQEKTNMFTERSEPVMLITCWYLCFPVSRALWFAIRCRCSVRRRSASTPLTFFMILSLALCLCFLFQSCLLLHWSLHNQQSLESAVPRVPVLTTIHVCVTNFIAFLCKAWRKCAHIYIYYMTAIVWAIWLVCLWAILSRIAQKVIAHFLIGTYKKHCTF